MVQVLLREPLNRLMKAGASRYWTVTASEKANTGGSPGL